jgi:predicted enzyme related to lactoylglutathione lyase
MSALERNMLSEKDFGSMSDSDNAARDAIVWHDLTVDDADELREFDSAVVGWTPEPVPMGDYAGLYRTAPKTEHS